MNYRRTRLLIALLCASATAWAEKERLDVSGQVFLDGDYYESFWSKDGDKSTTEIQLRNARVQFEYDFPKGWEGKLQIDADTDSDGQDIDLGSAYFRYTKWKFADITLGKMKEPLGLERNTRSAKLMTVEGSMMSTAFTPGKNWGVHLYDANKRRRWAVAAVVEDDQDNKFEEDEPIAVTGRYTWSPINSDQQTLQIGASGSFRDWKENIFQVRDRAEVGSADNVVRSARFRADRQSLVGLEGLWRHKSMMVQGEYINTRVEELDGPTWNYSGYYIMGSYLLTGEQRRFKKGSFRKIKPLAPSGAWELVARYSYLDVRDRGLGSIAAVSTLGVNYYYGKQVKVMLALLHPDISGSIRHEDPDGDAVSVRVQFLY
ncbi:MAG: porin [Halieaceae bacterium]|jgi:phosphate-selective porin OprO and OprP|nr:porin [Halieaceae bacterium]